MAIKVYVFDDARPSTNALIGQLRAEGREVFVFHDEKEQDELYQGERPIIGCGNIPTDLIHDLILNIEKSHSTGFVEVVRIGKAASYPNYDDTI